ncbi:MAG: iron dependent repressor, metal binding and dimerization domain protein, partial [Chloroflexota bacterium]
MTLYLIIAVLIVIILAQSVVIYRLWRQTRRETLGLNELTEDALKELYHLSRETPRVSERDLARAADLPPARFDLVRAELQRRGWAGVDEGGLRIQRPGERRAIELIRAHRLWERYLVDREGLALDAIHAEAMRREHLTSPEEIARLDAELGFPKFDPHGDPIPPAEGDLPHHAGGAPLARWPERAPARIVHVEDEPPALFSQLALLGLTPGAQVEIDERLPNRVLVWSGRQRLALAPAAVEMIFVAEPLPECMPLSEIEIGQAARVAAFSETLSPGGAAGAALAPGLAPGIEVAAVRADPLGDPVFYRIDGRELALSRIQANQVLVDPASLREIPLPRRGWLVEELAHIRELFVRYGSLAVLKRGLVFFGPAFVISVGYMDPGNW